MQNDWLHKLYVWLALPNLDAKEWDAPDPLQRLGYDF